MYLGKINAELTPRLQLKERRRPRSNKGLSIYRGPCFSPAKNTYTQQNPCSLENKPVEAWICSGFSSLTYCACLCACTHACAGQRTTFRSGCSLPFEVQSLTAVINTVLKASVSFCLCVLPSLPSIRSGSAEVMRCLSGLHGKHSDQLSHLQTFRSY